MTIEPTVNDIVKQITEDSPHTKEPKNHLSINGSVWLSFLTDEHVAHLSESEISLLLNSLNDSVQEICDIYEVKG